MDDQARVTEGEYSNAGFEQAKGRFESGRHTGCHGLAELPICVWLSTSRQLSPDAWGAQGKSPPAMPLQVHTSTPAFAGATHTASAAQRA